MSDAAKPIIEIQSITKRFGSDVIAVDDVNLDIREGEFFALLGPSGCGKTTLLRMIAGFEVPSEGEVLIDGQNMEDVPPNKRPINMVFQSYAVFPHMTVADNVAYGLKMDGVSSSEASGRVEEALDLVQLPGYGDRMPDQLSGGQRQRVALARALVKRPKVLLLDEPLSALDAKLREAMQLELRNLQATVGITFVMVTHDQDEALSMADRVAVMEHGRVRQLAAPRDLYEFPNCRFVADFIGKMNLFEGDVKSASGGTVGISVDGLGDLSIPHDGAAAGRIGIAIRPEKTVVTHNKPSETDRIALEGTVTQVAYHGDESHVFIKTDGGVTLSATVPTATRTTEPPANSGDRRWVSWRTADTLVLTD
ncbi:MAG: ABC transporter ATP-binding protein [Alphaproteobacteria bacterium]